MVWLLPGIGCLAINMILMNLFASCGMPRIVVVSPLVALAFNVAANLVVIPRLGFVGAAMTSSVAYALMLAMSLLYIRLRLFRRAACVSATRAGAATEPRLVRETVYGSRKRLAWVLRHLTQRRHGPGGRLRHRLHAVPAAREARLPACEGIDLDASSIEHGQELLRGRGPRSRHPRVPPARARGRASPAS